MTGHVHVYPVDPSLTADEAWDELCLWGFRYTDTGEPSWAVMHCDGHECSEIGYAR